MNILKPWNILSEFIFMVCELYLNKGHSLLPNRPGWYGGLGASVAGGVEDS